MKVLSRAEMFLEAGKIMGQKTWRYLFAVATQKKASRVLLPGYCSWQTHGFTQPANTLRPRLEGPFHRTVCSLVPQAGAGVGLLEGRMSSSQC